MITIKMPVIKQEVYCKTCNTLDTLDFIPAISIINDIWNYFSICKKCKSLLLGTYIDTVLLSHPNKQISLDITCISCEQNAFVYEDGTLSGNFHSRFYQKLYNYPNMVYYICSNTNEPVVWEIEKLAKFINIYYLFKKE